MAIVRLGEELVEIPDGTEARPAGEQLGVVFGCSMGICGTCLIEVEEGMENLSELSENEKDMCLEDNERLLCQCKVMKGVVKIKY